MYKEQYTEMYVNFSMLYHFIYTIIKFNARALIGQSSMVYCAGKPMEISCVFWIII